MTGQPIHTHRKYQALLETARCFGRAMDLNTLIDEIMNRAQEVMDAEAVSILLPEPESGDLILISTADKIRSLSRAPRVPNGKGIAGEVFRTRRAINVRDAANDPRHYRDIEAALPHFVTRAMLSVPLLEGERCLGVMQALNPLNREEFDAGSEELFLGFGGLIVNALIRIEAQQREIEQARTQQELNVAREIQASFLPPVMQRFPFCQVHMRHFPARVVSGDFYFLHEVTDSRILLGLGDVVGKGIPASLTMARATAMIKAMTAQLGDDLAAWIHYLNRQICEDVQAGRFIAATIALVDRDRNVCQICTAGQSSPLHFHAGKWNQLPARHQVPLGIFPDYHYTIETLPLEAGDYFLFFTDGIPEARNPAGEEFGMARIHDHLPKDLPSSGVLSTMIDAWHGFIADAPPHDDATWLVLDWRGPRPPATFSMTCEPEALCSARQFIEAWCNHLGYDHVTSGRIVLACDEAAANVFRHAYRGKSGPITFSIQTDPSTLTLTISDKADPVNPSRIRGRELSDLRPGGLGTVIMARVFDSIRYDPTPNGNTLILTKPLPDNVTENI